MGDEWRQFVPQMGGFEPEIGERIAVLMHDGIRMSGSHWSVVSHRVARAIHSESTELVTEAK
jgi:hypothetical protein